MSRQIDCQKCNRSLSKDKRYFRCSGCEVYFCPSCMDRFCLFCKAPVKEMAA